MDPTSARRHPVTAVAALAFLTLAACGEKAADAPQPTAVARGERWAIQRQPIPDYKPVAATVTTRRMGEARARIGGTLVRLNVEEGDHVKEGQVIALIVDVRLALATQASAAQAAAANAEAVRAQVDYDRIRTLYDKGIYAKARLDQAEATAKAAQGMLAAARAQRAASAELAAQGAILAPASGQVLKADVPAGSVVVAGQTVATVTAGAPLLRIELPEAQGRALAVGGIVRIDPRDLRNAAAAGTIMRVYPAVTAGRITADIEAPGLAADMVGQRVRVAVKLGERPAMIVPTRFVATRFGVDYLRVLDKAGRASDVAVQLAPGPDPAWMEVLSGLAGGDVIVPPQATS